jgi:hypothetical protein
MPRITPYVKTTLSGDIMLIASSAKDEDLLIAIRIDQIMKIHELALPNSTEVVISSDTSDSLIHAELSTNVTELVPIIYAP